MYKTQPIKGWSLRLLLWSKFLTCRQLGNLTVVQCSLNRDAGCLHRNINILAINALFVKFHVCSDNYYVLEMFSNRYDISIDNITPISLTESEDIYQKTKSTRSAQIRDVELDFSNKNISNNASKNSYGNQNSISLNANGGSTFAKQKKRVSLNLSGIPEEKSTDEESKSFSEKFGYKNKHVELRRKSAESFRGSRWSIRQLRVSFILLFC